MFKTGNQVPETPKMYKVCRTTPGGMSVSCNVQRICAAEKTVLAYTEGKITYAPPETPGIFIYETLEEAKRWLEGDFVFGEIREHKPHIYEVTPLGKQAPSPTGHGVCYPAVLVGKRVYEAKPPRPAPKFKVGDQVVPLHDLSPTLIVKKIVWSADDPGLRQLVVLTYLSRNSHTTLAHTEK
jgi:hypothetical protein